MAVNPNIKDMGCKVKIVKNITIISSVNNLSLLCVFTWDLIAVVYRVLDIHLLLSSCHMFFHGLTWSRLRVDDTATAIPKIPSK